MNIYSLSKFPISHWVNLTLVVLVIATLLLANNILPAGASTPVEAGYRDFSYPSGTGGNSEPTGEKPESKLWWNDGFWWGSMWSTAGNAYHIYRLDLNSQDWFDTGTALDDRSSSRADALWDGQKLYVVSHIFAKNAGAPASAGQRGELYRYSYNSQSKSYSLDSGFPVEVTGGKSETLVIEKDSGGTLWVTYVESSKVMVNHSLNGDDLSWGTPFVLPGGGQENVSSDDIASIIAYSNHIGVMWSNQNSPDEMYFAVHPVGSPDDVWTPVRTYAVSGDDHLNLKSLETDSAGNVFAAIKTSRSAALIVLLVCKNNLNHCKSENDWQSYTVYDGTFGPTRPIVVIDSSNRELYIFTRNKDADGSSIYYKKTSIDNIQFTVASIGVAFIKSATDTDINDPTSAKRNVNATTGLVVLASDGSSRHYFHNYLSLGGAPPATATFTPSPTSSPTYTPTFTDTASPTPTDTASPTPLPTDTPTPGHTASATPVSMDTSTPGPTPTPSATPAGTGTVSPGATEAWTPTSTSETVVWQQKLYFPWIMVQRGP